MRKGIVLSRIFWHLFFWANLTLILFYWWQGSHELFALGLPSILIALGRIAGLLAAYTVLIQFSFMGRNPWLEKSFGLDKLARVHQTSGKLALCFILLHPFLIVFGYAYLSGTNPWMQFVTFITSSREVLLAFAALTLFCIVVVTSLVIVRKRFRYESWYFVHLAVYLAILGSFFHQIELGHTITGTNLFYGYWIGLYTLVLVSHIVFRFLRPLFLFWKHGFTVDELVRENYNTVSVYISGRSLEKFRITPGQFMIFRFMTKGMWWQAHPFSLSHIPDGKRLRITVKELGDFTNNIKDLGKGTPVIIDGPYGVFTDFFSVSKSALFIAGGIGITPIRSLMEEMLAKGKQAVLLYANRAEKDIVFRKELDELSGRYRAPVTHVLSAEPGFNGEQGFVDEEKIQRLVPDVVKRDVYLCGPPPMMDKLIKMLQHIGVPMSSIHFERFSLR